MAYQGRFSQPRNTGEDVVLKAEPLKEQPEAAAETVKSPAPEKKAAPKQAAPVQTAPVKKSGKKKKKKKKANRTVTIVFYTCYFVLVAALLAGLFFLKSWLNDYLTDYQASQPTTRCEEIFQATFANPDWNALGAMAGVTTGEYETADVFADYMEARVNGRQLTYVETSAGLSGGHKYLLKLDSETVGYFTLVDNAPAGSNVADWQLGTVVLNYSFNQSVTVQSMEGITVFVNGVALTDDHTVQIGTTKVEEYLPAGVHGPRIYTQYLDGLMVQPQVTATDAAGNSAEVTYDEATGIYTVFTESNTISDEDYERVLLTAKTYSLRMIEKATAKELGKYFDSSSQTYKTIVSIDPWMQEWFFSSYEWGEESITGYYRHSDKLFSVHVDLSMFVTRTDDTVKEYKVDHSFFFEKQGNNWKCVNMMNVDIQEQTAIVRLTFKLGDNVVFTNLFEEDVTTLQPPTVTAPEGKVFSGWFRLDTAADGSSQYTLVFAPDDSGTITLPAGLKLEPMTFYALFEDAPANGGNN